MKFDAVIINYKTYHSLEECLRSLEKWEPERLGTVYVVDNSETPPPHGLISEFPEVAWLVNRSNLGFAKGVNQALKKTRAPWVCLLNPDAVLAGPLWGPLDHWLSDNPDAGVVGPKILDSDGSVQGSARSFPTLGTAFFGRTSLISKLWPDNPFTQRNILARDKSSEPVDVDWVSGACMVVRREAASQVGPMDERFFLYWEDCDWCARFRQAGWRVVYHPGLGPVVHHAGLASSRARLRSIYHFHKSAALLYSKYDTSPAKIGSAFAWLGALLGIGLLGIKRIVR